MRLPLADPALDPLGGAARAHVGGGHAPVRDDARRGDGIADVRAVDRSTTARPPRRAFDGAAQFA